MEREAEHILAEPAGQQDKSTSKSTRNAFSVISNGARGYIKRVINCRSSVDRLNRERDNGLRSFSKYLKNDDSYCFHLQKTAKKFNDVEKDGDRFELSSESGSGGDHDDQNGDVNREENNEDEDEMFE